MRTALHKLTRIGSVATFVALFTPACVDNNVTLFIRQVQAADPEDNCMVTNDPEEPFYAAGLLDTSISSAYQGWLLVGNQMVKRGSEETFRTESSRVQLYEAEVEVFDSGGGTLSSFYIPISGFVDVNTPEDPGYGLAAITMVDPGTGLALGGAGAQTIVSRMKVYGVTLGDLEVETGWYDFPITTCAGCIPCACPTSAEDEYYASCFPGNNEAVDCRFASCWDPANGQYCQCQPL